LILPWLGDTFLGSPAGDVAILRPIFQRVAI